MVRYTTIITPEDVRRRNFGSLGDTVNNAIASGSGDIYDEVVDKCDEVSDEVERYVNRRLIVRSHVLRFDACAWASLDRRYQTTDDAGLEEFLRVASARQWPVLQIRSVDDDVSFADQITILTDEEDENSPAPAYKRLLAYDSTLLVLDDDPYKASVFAGYRRADQIVGDASGSGSGSGSGEDTIDLTAQTGLSELTVTPPLLPGLIRSVALKLAIGDLREALQGLVGVTRTSKQIDRMTVQSETKEREFREKQLTRLYPYQYRNA